MKTPRTATLARAAAMGRLLLLFAAPTGIASAQIPAGFDQGLFELRLASGPAVTVTVLVNSAGAPLLPLGPTFSLTGYAADRLADSVRSIPGIGGARTVLDLSRREIRRRADTVSLGADEFAIVGGEIYLAAERVGTLVQAEALVEWSLLQVVLRRSTPFPAEQSRSAEARRLAIRERARIPARDQRAVPYVGRTGGAVLAWTISDAVPNPGSTLTGQTILGVAVAGGDLSIGSSFRAADDVPGGHADGTWSYRRAFPTSDIVRQVQVGDMVTGGASLRAIRGATVTNTQIVRDYFFADVPILPDVPSGWEYEVYQNGELLGYSDATSRAAITVPLRYGTTPLQVRLLSPSGEEIVREVLFQVPQSQLPPRRFEYALGGGECPPLSACERYGFAKADYGLTHWLTLGGGVETSGDTLDDRPRAFGSASYAGAAGWQGQAQVAHGLFARSALGYYGEGRWNGQVSANYARAGVGQATFLETASWRWSIDEVLVHRPRRWRGPVRALRLESRIEGERNDGIDRRRIGVGVDVPRGAVGLLYERDRTNTSGLYSVSALAILPGSLPSLLRNVAVTATVGYAPGDGVRQADAATSIRIGSRSSLSLAARWNEAASTTASLGFHTNLGFARSTTRALAVREGSSGAATTLNGIATFDREYGVTGYELGGPGLAGVGGTVFYDANGDGVRDSTELPATGVHVIVGGRRERTDASGEFHTWNVVPYEVVELSVDTLRGIAPSWIPSRRQILLRATPHVYNRVALPLVQTREVAGRVVAGDGVWTAGGVTILLKSIETGATQPVMTFSDGEFYLSRLRPGAYELRISPPALQALGAIADPEVTAFEVAAGDDESLLEIPPMTLRKPPVVEERLELAEVAPPPPPAPPVFLARGVLVLRGVTFDVGKATLRPESFVVLDSIAARLREDTTVRVEIGGHTDATGSRALNRRLSEARASAVRAHLIAQGVAADRLVARGYGPEQPVATNTTAAGRARNRRTELKRIP